MESRTENHTESQTEPHSVESLTASHSASNSAGHQLTGASRDISATESSRTNSHSTTANHEADIRCLVSATSVPLHPVPVHRTNKDPTRDQNTRLRYVFQPLRPKDASTDGWSVAAREITPRSTSMPVRVFAVEPANSPEDLSTLLQRPATPGEHIPHETLSAVQTNDPELQQLILFIKQGRLPPEENNCTENDPPAIPFHCCGGNTLLCRPKAWKPKTGCGASTSA